MGMRRTVLFPLFLMAWACGSGVDLDVDLVGQVPGDSGAPGSAPGSIDELAWSHTEFGAGTYNYVPAVAWAADGTLVASGMADDRGPEGPETQARLTRFAAGGEPLWTVELDADELDVGLPIPAPSEDVDLFWKSVTIDAVDVAADGTIVIAVNAAVDFIDDADSVAYPNTSTRSLVQWYDPDGGLLATVNLGGMTDFPRTDSRDDIVGLNSIRALPDGTAMWTGMSTKGLHPTAPDDLVAEGAIGRVAAHGEQPWTVVLGTELDFPSTVAPEEETAFDLHPTADGGVVLRGVFNGELVIGDRSARTNDRGMYVARLELDGQVSWLQAFDESEPVGFTSQGPGMGVTASGDVLAVVMFSGDHVPPAVPGSTRPCQGGACVVEIDPQGQLSSLNALELPPLEFPDGEYDSPDPRRMALAGDLMVVTGSASQDLGDHDVAWPGFVALHDLDGNLLAARGLGAPSPPPDSSSSVWVIAAGPDGQIAVGGDFYGAADLGAGTVVVEPPIESQGFLAVYEPVPFPPDVD